MKDLDSAALKSCEKTAFFNLYLVVLVAIFKCDSCGYERDVPDKLSGKKAKCPGCGKGVAIVVGISPADGVVDVSEDRGQALVSATEYGESSSLNLDNSSDYDDSLVDSVCRECGQVTQLEASGRCAACESEISQFCDLTELAEENVDVSDLAEDSSPQVWDRDFVGGETSLEEDFQESEGRSLLAGHLSVNIFAGLVSGLLCLFFSVALSLLMVSPQALHDYLPYALAAVLTGMAVSSIVFSFQSRIPYALAGPETVLSVVVSLLWGAIYSDMAGQYSDNAILATLIASLVVTSVLSGTGMWMIGKMKAGGLVRYIPIQIIGGVIGAAGVFVIIGTLDWIGPLSLDWNNLVVSVLKALPRMRVDESLSTMGPSVVFGCLLFFGLVKCKNSVLMLGLLLVASFAGSLAWEWGGDEAIKSLSMPIGHWEKGVPLVSLEVVLNGFSDIQWSVIHDNGLYIGTLVVLSILSTVYRITKLELLHGREEDVSYEYKALGFTNIICGLGGGAPATISCGRSAGNYASGGRGPVAGIVAGLVCGAGLFFIEDILPFIPKFVPEGLLFYAGLGLIQNWMFKSRTAFTRRDDTWMLWVTFFVCLSLDLLVGAGFGVTLAFMVTLSRDSMGEVARNVLSGANHRSNVDRAPIQQRLLKEYGDHIHIIRLQGFLSLGSMAELLKYIQKRLDNKNRLSVLFLILDFRLVTGVASAAGIGFDKLRKLVDKYGFQVVIASAPLELEEHLEVSGHLGEEEGAFQVFFNLDYAMEWCENQVLDVENMFTLKQMSLAKLLAPVFPEPQYIPALMKVLKRVDVVKGEVVFRQGDDSDSMFFVESGRLDVELEQEDGKLFRLKKVGPGAVLGEMGICTRAPRSATVRATEKCVLYKMTTEKLIAVEKRAPMLVTAIYRYMINMLAERLGDANSKVRDLMM